MIATGLTGCERFVHFLLLYGGESEIKPHAQDESPLGLLAQLAEQSAYYGARVPTEVVQEELAPPFWFFDLRLVRLAMDAALDNAWRFAQTRVELSAEKAKAAPKRALAAPPG